MKIYLQSIFVKSFGLLNGLSLSDSWAPPTLQEYPELNWSPFKNSQYVTSIADTKMKYLISNQNENFKILHKHTNSYTDQPHYHWA